MILPLWNNIIQLNQFNFTRIMQNHHGFKIKTINLDTDIFAQGYSQGQKFTVALIRSLTQRKNRKHKKVRDEGHQRSSRNIDREKHQYTQEYHHDRGLLNENHNHFEPFLQAQEDFLKRHTKTNPSSHKKESLTDRRPHFRRYNHSHSHSIEQKLQDPEYFFEKPHKQVAQGGLFKQGQNETAPPQDRINVNPYTKNQYIYMRNRELDELNQLKRSSKLTRMDSITKSYRVATINLTPQTSRRAHSFKIVMPSIHNKTKHSPFSNASFVKAAKKQSEIKPWEWNGPEQSKQYLM